MPKIIFRHKPAFSMLELVFVITILGIVSSIGAEVIAKVYESYILQRATHRSSLKTGLATTQIANRLAYAIPGTIIGRNAAGFSGINDISYANHNILQWIGYDNDSFSAQATPGWSGFADIGLTSATNAGQLSTLGSDLRISAAIISNLGGTMNNAAIFFPDTFDAYNIGYNPNITGVTAVTGTGINTLAVNLAGKTIKEHYKLAWTSYAIVASIPDANGLFNLTLYYNFQPWQGEAHTAGASQILLRNVSVFRFTGSETTIRFKICQQENIGGDFPITICKEKAVIR